MSKTNETTTETGSSRKPLLSEEDRKAVLELRKTQAVMNAKVAYLCDLAWFDFDRHSNDVLRHYDKQAKQWEELSDRAKAAHPKLQISGTRRGLEMWLAEVVEFKTRKSSKTTTGDDDDDGSASNGT